MANTIFEKQGGTYTQVGDYMLPDLLPAEEEKEANIGVWAMRHKRYLKQNHKVLYYNLLTSGKLNSYLSDIEQQAQQLFLQLVKDLAEKENVTKELKSTDMMLWVQRMNNIRNRTTEIVNAELIYVFEIKTLYLTNNEHRFAILSFANYRNKLISLGKYNDVLISWTHNQTY